MSKIYMYHTNLSSYQEVDEAREEQFREMGYEKVDKSDLVAVYNPNLGQSGHRTVLRSDVKNWVNRGFYAEPTVVYHPEQLPKTVSAEEAAVLMKNGWYDSPASFPKDDANAVVEHAVKNMKKGS